MYQPVNEMHAMIFAHVCTCICMYVYIYIYTSSSLALYEPPACAGPRTGKTASVSKSRARSSEVTRARKFPLQAPRHGHAHSYVKHVFLFKQF